MLNDPGRVYTFRGQRDQVLAELPLHTSLHTFTLSIIVLIFQDGAIFLHITNSRLLA
jgi:hypothetical protein